MTKLYRNYQSRSSLYRPLLCSFFSLPFTVGLLYQIGQHLKNRDAQKCVSIFCYGLSDKTELVAESDCITPGYSAAMSPLARRESDNRSGMTMVEAASSYSLQNKKEIHFLSAFLAEKWQTQNFGRELVFSADLCYNGANEKALPLGEVAAKPTERVRL